MLKWGSAKQRAADTIAADTTPLTPTGVKNSARFGVNRKGTGRFASSSPEKKKKSVSEFNRYYNSTLRELKKSKGKK